MNIRPKRTRRNTKEAAELAKRVREVKAANPSWTHAQIGAALNVDREVVTYYLGPKCKAVGVAL